MAEAPVPDTSIMREITGPDDTVVARIFSTTGEPQTKAAFDAALQYYQKNNRQAPPGFTILEPGVTSMLRQGFEAVNQPVQNQAKQFDVSLRNLLQGQLPPLGPQPGPMPPGAIQGPASLLTSTVNTPAKAGAALGTAAAAPFLGPVAGAGALPRALPMLGNMLTAGVTGAAGGALGRTLTGEPVTPGNVGVDASVAALSGGAAGLMDHFLMKYIGGDKAEAIATSMVKDLADQYPNLKNDPNLLNMVASGKEGLQAITQWGIKGLRGKVDDIAEGLTKGMVQDINFSAPRTFSVAQQNTLRAHGRDIVEAGNAVLNNIDNPEAYAKATDTLNQAGRKLYEYVQGELGKMKMADPAPVMLKIQQALTKQGAELQKFNEGAKVLAALRSSGQAEGFNASRFNDAIAGTYRQDPGSLLERVGQKLGQGKPLTKGPDVLPPAQEAAQSLLGMIKSHIPIVRHIPMGSAPTPTTLPWQQPSGILTPGTQIPALLAPNAAIRAGNEALRGFAQE